MTRTCPLLQLRRVLSRLSSGARRGAGGRGKVGPSVVAPDPDAAAVADWFDALSQPPRPISP